MPKRWLWKPWADTRVVVVNGARQVGKTPSPVDPQSQAGSQEELYLDDPAVLDAAREDPVGFVRHDELLLIDEVQRAPELLLPIKREVDRDPRPGRYLLTGSAACSTFGIFLMPCRDGGDDRIVALSQGEIDSAPDGFVDAVFRRGTGVDLRTTLGKRDYVSRGAARRISGGGST